MFLQKGQTQVYQQDMAGLDDNELLTPAEVASLFRVDPKTVTRWDRSGKLRAALRTPGSHRRYRVGDVRAALRVQP